MAVSMIFLFILALLLGRGNPADFLDTSSISRIAFGSCSHQDREQPLWSEIARYDPDYFVWLGDAVYADYRVRPMGWRAPSISRYSEQLHKMKVSPDYQSFQKRRTKIIGVWDDHDYGINDGGVSDEIYSAAVQDLFLHFLDEPADSPRRKRAGLYGSYLLGNGERTIKLILLDPRSQLNRETESVLGPDQWTWLDEELKSDPTTFTILGTGLPLLTERTYLDKWLLYPLERERLLAMVSRRPNTVIISGDSHFGEMQCANSTLGPLFELQSSGMTHNCLDLVPVMLCNYYIKYVSECSGCIAEPFVNLNFGTITVLWSGNPRVVLEVHGKDGVAIHYVVDLDLDPSLNHCPPKHEVAHQLVWQLTAISLVTLVLILLFYILSYVVVSVFARVVMLLRDKDHAE